jgi:hypothetical protein
MGEAELNRGQIIIHSHIICYGNAATNELSQQIRDEIEAMWNAPRATIYINGQDYLVQFHITSQYNKNVTELEILQNTDPRNNYFRIEEFALGNISFVDGLGCNTGYFKLENLYLGSTTAAHEYGHTLGLDHPQNMDIRGGGVPGIMYPRGTLVDPKFQYDPTKPAGVTGGTMHPMYRKVKTADIENIRLNKAKFVNGSAIIGDFTNVYHWNHAEVQDEGL